MNKKLSDIEYTTLWMAMRYAMGRQTITCSNLPGDIVRAYYYRLTDKQRENVVVQIDRARSEDVFKNLLSIDTLPWQKLQLAMDKNEHVVVELVTGEKVIAFRFDKRYYPLKEYINNPYIEIYIDDKHIKEVTNGT